MISEPEDYGLSPEATLAHRVEANRPPGFDGFWAEVREAAAVLPDRFRGSATGPENELQFSSLGNVRVVGWLHLPETAPAGAVVTTHGYAPGPARDGHGEAERWTSRGLAVLRLRVRGFPPSTFDVADLGTEWILHRIGAPESWVMRGAVVDLMVAYRCLRRHFGAALPVALHGESFGGGLAVIGAAQLAAMGDAPHRLAVGLPSLGDWRWRAGRYCNGAGELVNMVLEAARDGAGDLLAGLRLFDAALHAPDVRGDVLCKLALRDDTVPAPSAAAVYNALGCVRKWRFVTRYGHYDGGLADARRHALFERLHPAFTDPRQDAAAAISAAGHPLELQQVVE